jgi:hypothetical protein
MRTCGTMEYDVNGDDWVIRIDQEAYEAFHGMDLEIWIKDQYYDAYFERDDRMQEYSVTLEEDVVFKLMAIETYHIRISDRILHLHPILGLPF